MFQVAVQRDPDSAPQVLWSGDDRLEAWWQFVRYIGSTNDFASPQVMQAMQSSWLHDHEYRGRTSEIFCNGYIVSAV